MHKTSSSLSPGLGSAAMSLWEEGLGGIRGKGWLLLSPSLCVLQTKGAELPARVCGWVWLLSGSPWMWFVCRGLGAQPWMLFPALALLWGGLEQISPQPWAAFALLCQPCLISDLLGASPRLCVRDRPGSCWEPRRLHPKAAWASKCSPAIPGRPRWKCKPCTAAGLCLHLGVRGWGCLRSRGAGAASGQCPGELKVPSYQTEVGTEPWSSWSLDVPS